MLEVNSVEAFFNGDIKIPQFDEYVANQAIAAPLPSPSLILRSRIGFLFKNLSTPL